VHRVLLRQDGDPCPAEARELVNLLDGVDWHTGRRAPAGAGSRLAEGFEAAADRMAWKAPSAFLQESRDEHRARR
jgi:hypothetical protein